MTISQGALSEFLAEADEMLEAVIRNLGDMEKGSAPEGTLHAVYRDVHTIKGTSQLFGFWPVAELTHAIEAILDPYRASSAGLRMDDLDHIYSGLDVIKSLLGAIRKGRGDELEFPLSSQRRCKN